MTRNRRARRFLEHVGELARALPGGSLWAEVHLGVIRARYDTGITRFN